MPKTNFYFVVLIFLLAILEDVNSGGYGDMWGFIGMFLLIFFTFKLIVESQLFQAFMRGFLGDWDE